jgi:hypothetical protein
MELFFQLNIKEIYTKGNNWEQCHIHYSEAQSAWKPYPDFPFPSVSPFPLLLLSSSGHMYLEEKYSYEVVIVWKEGTLPVFNLPSLIFKQENLVR